MKLVKAQVSNFRNILDSSPVEIDADVTCLVGKNESGKTTFLHALHRLLPSHSNVSLSVPDHYPAWLEKRDRLQGLNLDEFRPVEAVFELEPADLEYIEEKFGKGILTENSVTLSKQYDGKLLSTLHIDEEKAVKHLLSQSQISPSNKKLVKDINNFSAFAAKVEELEAEHAEDDQTSAQFQSLREAIQELVGGNDLSSAIWSALEPKIPRFFYFDEYSSLPYSVNIQNLLKADPTTLGNEALTARSLLRLAAADDDYLLNPDYERRKRELENVANALTDDVLQYWSQNPELRVQPDISQRTVSAGQGQQSVLDELKIRIWDQRHSLSLPFNEHSTGFKWFFSFLAAFAEYEYQETPVVILLDEPALGLHARAQKDFLRFIDERLSQRHQVIYTTHSPFMVEPGKFERARIVEDRGKEYGATVSSDVNTTDPDTLFPLQGALGYDLVQHLFIAPHNLIVEGTSDFTYLTVFSDYFKTQEGRSFLNEQWSIVPVGGADLIPTFVALLGTHLDMTILVDAQKKGHQKLSNLASKGYLAEKRILTVGTVLDRKLADIEDVFAPEDYLELYNKAFGSKLRLEDLTGTDPIVNRIARAEGVERFDHGRPADELLRHRDEILPNLSTKTLERFETLFEKINETFPEDP
jgi:energy-coupling factor transporter ATP-binding protein EcfA2